MSQNRVPLWALSCALVFAAGFSFVAHASRALAATPAADAKADAEQIQDRLDETGRQYFPEMRKQDEVAFDHMQRSGRHAQRENAHLTILFRRIGSASTAPATTKTSRTTTCSAPSAEIAMATVSHAAPREPANDRTTSDATCCD